jgi:exopolysaccharide biosynthesis polyprenyl glycosylphosphotransferase
MAIDTAVRTGEAEAFHPYELSVPLDDRRSAADPVAWHDDATPALRRDAYFRRALAAGDLLALAVTGILTIGVDHLHAAALALVALLLLTAKTMSLYDRDQVLVNKRTLDEAPGLFHLATLVTFVFWLGQSTFTAPPLTAPDALLTWGVLFVSLLASRGLARRFAQATTPVERCLVVAEANEHARLAEKLELDHRLKSRVVAHLPLLERRAESFEPPHAALERCVRSLAVHRVVVAPDGVEPGVVLDVVSRAKQLGVNVSVLPRVCEVIGSSVEFDDLGGMTLLGVRPFRLSRSSQVIKRGVDVVGASLIMLIGAPFFALLALAIKLDSKGPILFRQTRVGQDGRHFQMLKFRSMIEGAHLERDDLVSERQRRELFKLAHDPRITRVGRLLRRSSLDELPQLLNVVRGEMSLVGPRPLILEEDAMVVGYHRRRLHLKPGLTGPWQVLGSPDVRVGIDDMATIDYLYAVHWSLWADVQVILRTIAHVLRARGV